MKPSHHLFLLILLCLSEVVFSRVDLFEKGTGETWNKSELVTKFTLVFLPIGEKPGKKLVYKGTVTLAKEAASAEPANETTLVEVSKNTLNIQMFSFEEKIKIKYTDNSETEIKLDMVETQFRMYNDKCKDFLINVRIAPTDKNSKIPIFPMAVSCNKYEDKLIFVTSMPAEIDPGESSLVEGGGKGEFWKFYELPSTARDDGIIGNIKFVVKNVELNLTLQNIRLKENEPAKKDLVSNEPAYFQKMSAGLGTKSLSFTAGEVSSAASGIALSLSALSKPVWRKFQLGGSYSTALVSSSNENSITFYDFSGLIGYQFEFGKSKLMPFTFGKSVDFLHKLTQTRLQAVLAGVGADYVFDFNRNQISFNLELGVFTAKGVSSQMRYQLGYQYLLYEKSRFGVGIYYSNQDFKAVNSANQGRTFKDGDILVKGILNGF